MPAQCGEVCIPINKKDTNIPKYSAKSNSKCAMVHKKCKSI